MFDWDEQELANIIWGEDTEAGDHIVPFPEDIENKNLPDYGDTDRQTLNEEDTNSKAVEKISSTSKLFPGGKGGKNDGVSASEIVMGPQLDLPSFASSQINNNAIVTKTELDIGREVSGNQHEDKELGELVGNSWANIGSFDDLDRIFSNDELDGHTGLGSTDALWAPSKELISGAAESSSALRSSSWEFGDLGSSSSLIEPNSEYLQNEYPSAATICEKTGITSSYTRRISGRLVEHQKYAAGASSLIEEKTTFSLAGKTAINHVAAETVAPPDNSSDKDDWSKHQQKYGQKLDQVKESGLSGNVYDKWPSSAANTPQYDRGCAPTRVRTFPAPIDCQQKLPNESRPMAYQQFTNAYAAPYAYSHRNFPQQYSATQMLRPTDNEHQSILPCSEARQGDAATARPLKMTPQEKIEKLKRRQQMRAMLAIQKQQKQLGHQASSVDFPLSQKNYQEDQIMHMGKPDLEADESLATLPCYDPGSPNKIDDLGAISDVDEYSAEDTVLYQLQDIIARLDMKIRLSIKDSLYRLAQSATQRHFTSDTSTANRSGTCHPDVAKEEISSHHRISGNANVETETNHIDRTVAHLLFHQPFKLSVKHAETPESLTANRISSEQETAASSRPSGLLAKTSDNDAILSPRGLRTPRSFVDTDVLTGMSNTEIKVDLQMEQKTVEHAD